VRYFNQLYKSFQRNRFLKLVVNMPNFKAIWEKSIVQEQFSFIFHNLPILETIWTDFGNNGRHSKSNMEIKTPIKSI